MSFPPVIVPARGIHMNHVVKTWQDSFLSENHAGSLPYDIHVNAYRESIVERIIPRSYILIAADPTNTDVCVGWICYGPEPQVLHYVFVKKDFQRARDTMNWDRGVATALLMSALDLRRDINCTHMTQDLRHAAIHSGWRTNWRAHLIRKGDFGNGTPVFKQGPRPTAPGIDPRYADAGSPADAA